MKYLIAGLIIFWTLAISTILFFFERIVWLICLPLVAVALPFRHASTTQLTGDGNVLWKLPFWINWCAGNDNDGFGDWRHAVEDCGYAGIDGYNTFSMKNYWLWYCWLMLRNPMHNLNRNIWAYHCNFKRVNNVYFVGGKQVDNRYNTDGTLQSGLQICWATGAWMYLRAGLFLVLPLWGSKCFRLRIGYKVQPRHCDVIERQNEPQVLWTFSPFSIKSII